MVPDDALTIEEIVAAISQHPRGRALLAVGNLNTDLADIVGRERNEGVAVAMAEEGV